MTLPPVGQDGIEGGTPTSTLTDGKLLLIRSGNFLNCFECYFSLPTIIKLKIDLKYISSVLDIY